MFAPIVYSPLSEIPLYSICNSLDGDIRRSDFKDTRLRAHQVDYMFNVLHENLKDLTLP